MDRTALDRLRKWLAEEVESVQRNFERGLEPNSYFLNVGRINQLRRMQGQVQELIRTINAPGEDDAQE